MFGFKLNYNTVEHGGTPLFNGNIAETSWATTSANNTSNPVSTNYRYEYDALNRIVSATDNTGNYNISGITYDKMGNIQSLIRKGWQNGSNFTDMDILDYDYDSGNKLLKVTDTGNKTYGFKELVTTGNDYRYDQNGNLLMDKNKGVGSDAMDGIEYNHLNLPTKVEIDGGTIDYVYDAMGVKLRKEVSTGAVTEYAGNYIYSGNQTQTDLEFFNHPEGYVNIENNGYRYVYQYKDHLDNVRLSYTENPSEPGEPTIIEENNYYPFGGLHKGYNMGGDTSLGNDFAQKWKFGGKELDESLGLETYDFGARNYDPWIGRWGNIDPKAYKYYSYSPYNFAVNSPLVFVDPDGKELVLAGNRKERRQLFREIKKLTNDRLKLNRKTGQVTVRGKGGRNGSKNLNEGTSLVAGIIGSENTVTAMTLGGFKNKFGKTETMLGTVTNEQVMGLTGNGALAGKDNPLLGIGSEDAMVIFDSNDSGEDVLNEDGSKGRPNFIGLAHELVHGSRIINGEVVEGTELSQNYIDPDSPSLGPGGNPNTFHDEEMEVRDIENVIRTEHRLIKRASPIFVDPNKDLDEFLKQTKNKGRN